MIIKYLAHAAFLINAQNETKIITDPYHPAPDLKYSPIDESADIVTSSHSHNDHNAVESIGGQPRLFTETGNWSLNGITVKGVAAFHDDQGGRQRGRNIIYCFKVDGLNLCHLGDLGQALEASQLDVLKPVDVLLLPVGGFFTIDLKTAAATAAALNARVIIPMHYKTAKAGLPIAPIDDFLAGKKNVRRLKSSSLEISRDTLPAAPEIIVLQPAN
jgi:L-ascorbate metabolism protein UlaG (beta-lactamase superfamily)